MGIRDTRMIERALRERWPIKPEFREKIMNALIAILADKNTSPREKTAAARALMYADSLNLEQEKLNQNDEHHHERLTMESLHRIAGVAQQLGFDTIAQRAIEAGSSGSVIDVDT